MFCGAAAEIRLDRLAHNWNVLRRCAGGAQGARSATVVPVIKTNAYGFGTAQVSHCLWDLGARNFFVFTVDEALTLRAEFPQACIMMLGGLPLESGGDSGKGMEMARELIAHRLLPAIGTLDELETWRKAAGHHGKKLPLVLHFDTGLNRYALPPKEIERVIENPKKYLSGLSPAVWMSHLLSAEIADDPANRRQLERFERITSQLPKATRSLANSCGIALGKEWHYEMVRSGAALYGIEGPRGIKRVLRLRAPVMQIKELAKGEAIGYNSLWRAPRARARVATIAFGYADGLSRTTPQGTPLWFGDIPLPICGMISMDMVSVEAPPGLRVGSMVDILAPPEGGVRSVRTVAPLDYTRMLTCQLGLRLPRLYRGSIARTEKIVHNRGDA
ncbi:MAG: alanine racemase [Alphaproteobacteria bacterium]